MTEINKIVYGDKAIKLAIPVHLSDDEMPFLENGFNSDREVAFFLFNIVQKQIEQLIADKEKEKK